MNHTLKTTLFTTTLLALVAAAPGQEAQSEHKHKPAPKLVLEPGEHALTDLIDRSARYLKRNYLYSDNEMANTSFSLQTGVAMDQSNCEDFLSQIAYTKGFAMTPVNRKLDVFEFINMRGQNRARVFMNSTVMTPAQVHAHDGRYIVVTTTLTTKHVDAMRATAQLRPFFAMSGHQGALSFTALSNRSLIMTGFAPQVARALEMLAMADLPERKPETQKPPRKVR